MKSWVIRALRVLTAVALFAALLPGAAGAQETDQRQGPMIPSYAHPVDTIQGTISRFDGPTTMYVRDAKGYIDRVTLHKGTIINPTGIKLVPGFSVTITGQPDGSAFVANEIDTPYHIVDVYPYGYPYAYPAFGLGFGFGWGGWHHHW